MEHRAPRLALVFVLFALGGRTHQGVPVAALGHPAANLDKKAHASTLHCHSGGETLISHGEKDNSGKFPHQDLFSFITTSRPSISNHDIVKYVCGTDNIRTKFGGVRLPPLNIDFSLPLCCSLQARFDSILSTGLYGDDLLSTEYLVQY
jgi:hypothetical protein